MNQNKAASDFEKIGITNNSVGAASGLKHAIPALLAKQTADYEVEYGIREDDGAIVFHFYAPGRGEWDPAWDATARLERALPMCFDTSKLHAEYISIVHSYCIIVKDLGFSPDPWPLVERFLSEVERGLVS